MDRTFLSVDIIKDMMYNKYADRDSNSKRGLLTLLLHLLMSIFKRRFEMNKDITYKRVKELFDYDDGCLIWAKRPFRNSPMKKGDRAGECMHHSGYKVIKIDQKQYLTHIIVWLRIYGYLPENEIDHINRIKSDNKIDNLREVSHSCNMRNIGVMKTNKSGVTGVFKKTGYKNWFAVIIVNGNKITLGDYKNKIDAIKSRWKAEIKYNWANCCTTSSAYLYLKQRGLIGS